MIFFFNDTATTEIYTLSLHDALPICWHEFPLAMTGRGPPPGGSIRHVNPATPCRSELSWRSPSVRERVIDRKSTRLNSSHANISYAVFCLKKKKKKALVCITD